jgi:hypothetical protein
MDTFSNCSVNFSSDFFETYNYTINFAQQFANFSTRCTAAICIIAVIINTALSVTLPKLIRTHQLAFKRYVFILNLSVSDIIGCTVIGSLSIFQLSAKRSLFGDFINANFEGIYSSFPSIIIVSYPAQIVYTTISVLQYVAICRPLLYRVHVTKRKVVNLCLFTWFLTIALAPAAVLPDILVKDCFVKPRCLYPTLIFRGIVLWQNRSICLSKFVQPTFFGIQFLIFT